MLQIVAASHLAEKEVVPVDVVMHYLDSSPSFRVMEWQMMQDVDLQRNRGVRWIAQFVSSAHLYFVVGQQIASDAVSSLGNSG